jgi:GNAT superfamily N-acetyltransferase
VTGVDSLGTVTVVELANVDVARRREVTQCLARWHAEEWGHLYEPDVWNLDVARGEFEEQVALGGGCVPTTYAAFTHGDRLVGSVSLVNSDDLEGFGHLGPWLASLYVERTQRRRGIGRLLIAHLLAQPPARQSRAVYLFTPDHAAWYASMGWEPLATTTTGPHAHEVTVMVRRAEEA